MSVAKHLWEAIMTGSESGFLGSYKYFLSDTLQDLQLRIVKEDLPCLWDAMRTTELDLQKYIDMDRLILTETDFTIDMISGKYIAYKEIK